MNTQNKRTEDNDIRSDLAGHILSEPACYSSYICSPRSEDIETLAAIRYQAIISLASEKMGRNNAQAWANSATSDRVKRAIQEHRVYVAQIARQVVGWIEINDSRIEGLYVHPIWTKQGVGCNLLAYAEAQMAAAGYSSIQLDASWNAEQFYFNRGYQALSERSPDLGRPMIKSLVPSSE